LAVLIGVLSLVVGAFCFYAPRSAWALRHYELKFGAEAAEKQAAYIRTFQYIGIAWIIMGLLHLFTL
jgi:uncharacterized membrane protein HdeD (DUF308 family)